MNRSRPWAQQREESKSEDGIGNGGIENLMGNWQANQTLAYYWWHHKFCMTYHYQLWAWTYNLYLQGVGEAPRCTCGEDSGFSETIFEQQCTEFKNKNLRDNSFFKSNSLKRTRERFQEGNNRTRGVGKISEHELESYVDKEQGQERFEMELNDEFREFLEISEKHRQERDRMKMQKGKKSKSKSKYIRKREDDYYGEYIDASEQHLITTIDAPNNINNKRELEKLYGPGYGEVLGLEAELQLSFNKFCDQNKPAFWPNIPLRL